MLRSFIPDYLCKFVKSFQCFTDVVNNKQTMNEVIIKQDNHLLEKCQS